MLVVLKPQNIPVQGDESGDNDFLNMLKAYIKQKHDKPGNVFLGLVHRLDRPTGGIMVFAKTSKAAARISEQIKDGTLEKKYFAVCVGTPKALSGFLVHYLVKDSKTNTVAIAPSTIEGAKRAELSYKVVASTPEMSLVDIKLITGRSHQIRVQMKALSTPVYGDSRYGADKYRKSPHLALWAYELRFLHPISSVPMVFKVFPPEEFPWTTFAMEKYIVINKPN